MRKVQSLILGLVMVLLRYTCRTVVHNDPRTRLRQSSQPYVYSILHANLVSAAIKRERNTAAMLSLSGDAELLVDGFAMLRIKAIRGSSKRQRDSKGGMQALDQLISHVGCGAPAILAVDGPRGPRNRVRKGIAVLSMKSGAAVLNVVVVPKSRIVLRSWDRLQIPMPFTRLDAYFSEPLWPRENESAESFRQRIELSLNGLEANHDSEQASAGTRHKSLAA